MTLFDFCPSVAGRNVQNGLYSILYEGNNCSLYMEDGSLDRSLRAYVSDSKAFQQSTTTTTIIIIIISASVA